MKKALRKLYRLETYEDLLIKVLRFFIKRNPLAPIYALTVIAKNKLNKKNPVISKQVQVYNLNQKVLANAKNQTNQELKGSGYKPEPVHRKTGFKKTFKQIQNHFSSHHPYISATSSFLTILIVITALSYIFIFQNPEEAGAAWWNDQWLYRKELTINSSQVTGDPGCSSGTCLTNFPILVSITDGELATNAQSDGDDIVFTENQGNKLDHEIESYDNSTGTLVAWVRIPVLDGDNDSSIYMYYGNQTTGPQQNKEGVWDDNYMGTWHLNATSDSTRNNNDGTAENEAAVSADGKVGSSFQFDGNGDSLNVGNSNTVNSEGVLTLSAWIRETDASGYSNDRVFGKKDSWSDNDGFDISIRSSNNLRVVGSSSVTRDYTCVTDWSTTDLNRWVHVAIVFNGSNATVYCDGADKGTQSVGSVTGNDNDLLIGLMSGEAANGFYGNIDEARISNTSRSASWIQTEYNNQNAPGTFLTASSEEVGPGPVGYWAFDEGYGSTTYDASGQGNNGTITSAVWQDESQCVSGKCLYFDGSSDYVDVGDPDTLDMGTSDFTLTAWVKTSKTTTDATTQGIFGKRGNAAGIGYDLRIYDGAVRSYIRDADDSIHNITDSTSQTYSDGLWHYIVAVFDRSGSVTHYIDGKVDASEDITANNASVDNAYNLYLGANYSTNGYFEGFIDEVKIYPYARSADQIKQDYAAGLAGVSSSHGVSASFGGSSDQWLSDGLVGYWKMDESSWDGTTNEVIDSSGSNNHGTSATNDSGTSSGTNTSTTLNDTTKSWTVNGYANHNLTITGGTGSGQTAAISSNTATALTISSAWTTTPDATSTYRITSTTDTGKFGNGFEGNGSDDYVVVSDDDVLDFGNEDFTMSFWMNSDITPVGNGDALLCKGGWTSTDEGCQITLETNNSIQLECTGDNVRPISASGGSLTNNGSTWHHVLAAVDRDVGYKVYIDGDLGFSGEVDSSGYNFNSTYNLGIGSRPTADRYFDGQIDEVRVYNRSLSAREAKNIYQWAPGPVAHWKMDERVAGDAQTLRDTSGQANDGTTSWGANASGMDCTVQGKYGSACDFDGEDDYADVDSVNNYINKQQGSFTAWVNARSYVFAADHMAGAVVGVGQASSSNAIGISPTSNSDLSMWYISGGVSQEATISGVPINEWYHVAGTWDDSNVSIYFNGVLTGTDTQGVIITETLDSGEVGADFQGTMQRYFDGQIDDVKVYNYARTGEQIIEDMNAGHPVGGSPVASQVAYWKFDEGYGATAYDSAGSNNGTLTPSTGGTNTTTAAMWDLDGKYGKAIEFDGTDDYVEMADDPAFDITDEITLSAWIKPTAAAQSLYSRIISRAPDAGGNEYYALLTNDSPSNAVGVRINQINTIFSTSIAPTGEWTHVTGTYDGATLKIYFNGELENSSSLTTTIPTASTPIHIGDRSDDATNRRFEGSIDEVKIYNVALTAEQVRTEYNQGKAQVLGSSGTDSSTGAPTRAARGEYCVPGDTSTCNPPVLELKMDEMTGTTAYDTSGGGNDGTLGGGATWNPLGRIGSALDFDGNDDYVSYTSTDVSEVTISTWAYLSSKGESDYPRIIETPAYALIFNQTGGAANNSVELGVKRTSVGWWNTPTDSVQSGSWYHISATYDESLESNVPEIYINGIKQAITENSTPSGSISSNAGTGYIGNRAATDRTWDGVIDDIRVYDYIRTPAQIAWDYNKGAPVAHWRMDETSGATAHDESGNSNDGTLTNMDPGTDWVSGKNNNALDFDGTDDYIQTTSDEIETATEFTLSVWIKNGDADITSGERYMILWQGDSAGNGGGAEQEMHLNLGEVRSSTNNELQFFIDQDGTDGNDLEDIDLTYYIGPGFTDWHHIAVVVKDFDTTSADAEMFLDGASIATDSSGGTIPVASWNTNLRIGRPGTAERFFDGQIDDVRVYNYALTAEQIKGVYTNGAVSFR